MAIEVLDQAAARALTERIRQTAGDLWSLLAQAHDQRAWEALGYGSFRDYVSGEFEMSRRHAYRLLDQARVVDAISSASGVTNWSHRPVSELEARELKPHLEMVVQNVHDATVDTEPELKEEAARAAIEETRKQIREITKPDLGNGVSHPARYGNDLLDVFALHLHPGWKVLDPFAGTGKVHLLRELADVYTTGIEIEPEWAAMHPDTQVGDALELPFAAATFDAIVTSPTYGNRLADNHNASDPERRRSYKHDLGRDLHQNNSGALQWGTEYRAFHTAAWAEAIRVLRPGGRFLLNIKDHIRAGEPQPVTGWHITHLTRAGLSLRWCVPVEQKGLRWGTNRERTPCEFVVVFEKDPV